MKIDELTESMRRDSKILTTDERIKLMKKAKILDDDGKVASNFSTEIKAEFVTKKVDLKIQTEAQ